MKPIAEFIINVLAISAAAASAIAISDSCNWFESDLANNHTEKKWEAFYDFTSHNNVDVVLVGNSRLYTGINPKNLSAASGSACFILASPGTTVVDSYYCLKEALARTDPKIAIIETFTIDNSRNHELKGQKLSDQFKSFSARKNIPLKILSLPALFSTDHWIEALSTTVRNHSFIFKEPEQLKRNIIQSGRKAYDRRRDGLYLGRYVRFTTGIQKEVLDRYLKEGAPVDESKYSIGPEHRKYVRKIVRLCRKKGVTPLFLSLPVYKEHVINYYARHNALENLFSSLSVKWIDMQADYSRYFDTSCFENTYKPNQHMTYQGSLRASYLLADYISKELPGVLPDRSKDQQWKRVFYGQEGYFENYPPEPGDRNNIIIPVYSQPDSLIMEADFIKGSDFNELILKTRKGLSFKSFSLLCKAVYGGKEGTAELIAYSAMDWMPKRFSIYLCRTRNDLNITGIISAKAL